MLPRSMCFMVLALLLVPTASSAEPVTLKMSFFTSDRSTIYECQIKPFVDAINQDGSGQVRVEVTFGAGANRVLADQAKLILDGTTDVASLAPTAAPDQFPDTAVLLLPGLFRDTAEGNQVFRRLVDAGALSEYEKFVVLGTSLSAGDDIHSRKPIAKLADLRGQTIRGSNDIEIVTLKKFGANSVFFPLNQTMDSLAQGQLDGVTGAPSILFEFGFGRLTSNHYMLRLSSIPGILAISRAKFESLPTGAQEVIRKYSGAWLLEKSLSCLISKDQEVMAFLKNAAARKVISPSPADQAEADKVFAAVTEEWVAQSPRHRELLNLVRAEIAKVRSAK